MDEARDWLRIARSNLRLGASYNKLLDNEIRFEELCFELQQCAEKSLKALLIHRGVKFPRTHAIAELLDLLIENGVLVPSEIIDSAKLTQYAVEARYPDVGSSVTEDEYRRALELARMVYGWVENQLS